MPSDPQTDGPSQVEASIENDQIISQQFTLWEGAGSQIVRGQLLVIPVLDTIIYVEPLYLQSEVLAFPELKKVILADAGNVVMADSVQEGLALLWGGSPPLNPAKTGEIRNGRTQTEGEFPQDGLIQGIEELDRIDEAVTGVGEALDDLQEALDRLRETFGGASQ